MGTIGTGDGLFGRFLKRLFFVEQKDSAMSSSYVEVRETENGTESEVLPFGMDQCDSNGLEMQAQVDGEPPKDHTYNKDPVVVQESGDEAFATSAEEDLLKLNEGNDIESKKPARSPRNVKPHKFIKARTPSKTAKSPVKKEAPSRKGARRKAVSVAEMKEEEPEVEKSVEDNLPAESETSPMEVDNAENENTETAAVEQSPQKKKSRKRKAEVEKEVQPAKRTPELSPKKEKAVEPESPKKENVSEPESPKKEPQRRVKAENTKDTKKNKLAATKSSPKEKAQKPSKKEKAVVTDKGKSTNNEPNLPKGWTRKVVERKSGKTAGLFDIYIYSPEGVKFRSKPDIAAYLAKTKSSLKVDDFNFTKRGITGSTVKPQTASKEKVKARKTSLPTKPAEKVVAKPKKKAAGSATGKKGQKQKLVVKLNFTTPKKRILSDYEKQKSTEKSKQAHKAVESKPSTSGVGQKRTGGNRRKKAA